MEPYLSINLALDEFPEPMQAPWLTTAGIAELTLIRHLPSAIVLPQRGPLDGLQVTVRTDQDGVTPSSLCLCRFGELQVSAVCLSQLQAIVCTAPPVLFAQQVQLQFSINNGLDWSDPGLIFEYYRTPFFSAIEPPLGNMLAISNLTVYGQNFPNSTGIPVYCRWLSKFVVVAEVDSQSVMRCPAPAEPRMASWDPALQSLPLSLEVSFAGRPPVWIPVNGSIEFYSMTCR